MISVFLISEISKKLFFDPNWFDYSAYDRYRIKDTLAYEYHIVETHTDSGVSTASSRLICIHSNRKCNSLILTQVNIPVYIIRYVNIVDRFNRVSCDIANERCQTLSYLSGCYTHFLGIFRRVCVRAETCDLVSIFFCNHIMREKKNGEINAKDDAKQTKDRNIFAIGR